MADTPLTNRQIVQKPVIVINPNFPIPPGLDDVRQGDDRLPTTSRDFGIASPGGSAPSTDPTGPDLPDGGTPTGGARVPGNIRIVSQALKFNPDGTYVVDAVLEFDDVAGAERYEVRLTRADGVAV